ncbi:DUF4112 domain-containing protein [Aurantimonas endophytica]|uniref:DUF4112 domain-containing protein n=1 Tax=Aurantimonas endophytica TaxID=1522175 RepID=A0A7W6MNV0_9HYPH|nr:DUF4112 domain-containing protein [Aurantimonas endophytica]MBB4002325.1 hypothetical protein [Aurantimonas endophytica]MCO6402051.1 DUF4112 domain-containing protein [Aurantimonas endophytica]
MKTPQTPLHPDHVRRLRRVSRLARLMDTAIRIPGTGIRFGGDSVLGLIPGIGDLAGGAIGLYIVNEARQLGLPTSKIVKMLSNLGLDVVIGAVPLAGDVADVFFKAHRRNLNIILEHFGEADTDFGEKMRERPMKDITPKRR